MVNTAAQPDQSKVRWKSAVRIIRSHHPPIDLFEDIADPQDWPLLISAEQKTNPRLMATIGNLDLVPASRRVAGPGASWLMAPFTHVSPDRPSRFSDGRFGALYVGEHFDVALLETMHHHARFMAATEEAPGWTSQFRELTLSVEATLSDLRIARSRWQAALDPNHYGASQELARRLRANGAGGVVYPSVRCTSGDCVALFYPDLASTPRQGRHLDYHWDGARVDLYRDVSSAKVVRVL